MYKEIIPLPNPDLLKRVQFWLSLVSLFLQSGTAFFINVITWEVVKINDVAVVTYENLISLFYGIMGCIIIIFVGWYVKNRNPYKKRQKNET